MRNLKTELTYPLLLLCPVMLILSFVSADARLLPFFLSFCLPSYIAYHRFKNKKYAVPCGVILFSGNLLYYLLSERTFSIVLILILSVITVVMMKKAGLLYGYMISLIAVCLTAYIIFLAEKNIQSLTFSVASFTGKRSVLFGIIGSLWELFISTGLRALIYHTGVSEALLINGEVVSGVRNIFLADARHPLVSAYLTGRYYESIVIPLGIAPLLAKRLLPKERYALLLLILFTAVSGDSRLFSLYLLIYQPLLYFAYLCLIGVAFLTTALLHISIGFSEQPSVVSLIQYMDKPLYFLISGLIIALLAYYLSKIILIKTDFQNSEYYPKQVLSLFEALGGRENILSVNEHDLTVANPNLINRLKTECDIQQNRILLNHEDFNLIKAYLKE